MKSSGIFGHAACADRVGERETNHQKGEQQRNADCYADAASLISRGTYYRRHCEHVVKNRDFLNGANDPLDDAEVVRLPPQTPLFA
jgi:hypothetical protein